MIFTNDPQLMKLAVWALRIYMAGVLLMGAQVACQQTFIAFGNAKISTFLAIFRKIIVLIPMIYILPVFMKDKVLGVFMAEPIADTIAVCTTCVMFFVSFKKLIKEMKKKIKKGNRPNLRSVPFVSILFHPSSKCRVCSGLIPRIQSYRPDDDSEEK